MLTVSNASTLPIASSVIGTSFCTTCAVTTGTAPPSPPRPPRPLPAPRPVAAVVAADPLPHASDVSDVSDKPNSATAHTNRLVITTSAPAVKGRPHEQIPGSFDAHLPADRLSACALRTIDAVAASPLDRPTVSLRRRLCQSGSTISRCGWSKRSCLELDAQRDRTCEYFERPAHSCWSSFFHRGRLPPRRSRCLPTRSRSRSFRHHC